MQPNRDADFERMIASFEAIAQDKKKTQQLFHLYWASRFHGIAYARFREMYRAWLTERGSMGGESDA